MINEKIAKVEKSVNDIRSFQEKTQKLIDERKLKFSMIGLNEVIKALAEIMTLEKVLDGLNELIDLDNEEMGIMIPKSLKGEIPGAKEMLGYISLEYRSTLSDECKVIKKFIDEFQYQEIEKLLFE